MTTTNLHQLVGDEDRDFFERELASFVPDRVFDAHAHLWRNDFCAVELPPRFPSGVGYEEYLALSECLHPGRKVGAFFLPQPLLKKPEQSLQASEWVSKHVRGRPAYRGACLIKPEDDPERLREQVRHLGLHGLKCYHLLARSTPSWEADIPDYLPEKVMKVADDEGWVIMLHMVKSRAVADPGNLHWIRHYCQTYPNMKLILAHSARGFQPAHNFEGLPQLSGLDNLYFECSANCEAMAHVAIIQIMGHKKLMYGSDFSLASHSRGRSVAAGDSFLWLQEDSPVWIEKYARIKPVLVALEHLRSLKWACWSTGLNDSAVEDIFWNNAAELFGLK